MSRSVMNSFNPLDVCLGFVDQTLHPAVLKGHLAQDLFHCGAAPFGIVGGQRLAGEVTAPKLPGHEIHVALDADEFRFRLGQNLLGRYIRLKIEFHFFRELFLAQPPLTFCPGQQIFFQELLILP